MKFIIPLLFSVLILNSSYSQDSTIALSQFEMFTGQPNKILKTEIRQIGTIGWRNLYLFKTTDLASETSAMAIRMGNFNSGYLPALIDTEALYIDLDDLDSIIHVLDQFVKEAGSPKPSTNFQLSYTTSNDIVFTCTYNLFYDSWRYEMGKVYKNLRTYVPNTVSTFNKKRFSEIVELLKKAKTLQL